MAIESAVLGNEIVDHSQSMATGPRAMVIGRIGRRLAVSATSQGLISIQHMN
jgi:hypothetical protein